MSRATPEIGFPTSDSEDFPPRDRVEGLKAGIDRA